MGRVYDGQEQCGEPLSGELCEEQGNMHERSEEGHDRWAPPQQYTQRELTRPQ